MTTINATNTPQLTTNGQVIIGSTGAFPVAATLTAGTNITITNGAGSITIAAVNEPGPFSEVSGTTQTIAVNNRYSANNAGVVTFTLPAAAAIGDTFEIMGKGAGKFAIAQNASGQINFCSLSTTAGVGGSLTAIQQYNWIRCTCITANNIWDVTGATGDYTIV
jgi:hypothetical protein